MRVNEVIANQVQFSKKKKIEVNESNSRHQIGNF